MNKTPKIQIKYFLNKTTKKLYKVVNNKYSYMWYQSKCDWFRCATSPKDILDGFYKSRYDIVDERNLSLFK